MTDKEIIKALETEAEYWKEERKKIPEGNSDRGLMQNLELQYRCAIKLVKRVTDSEAVKESHRVYRRRAK